MNKIAFSHRYTKIHGQTSGILISVLPFAMKKCSLDVETLIYDTDGKYNIEDGYYLQLIFLGNKEIPFTTYRTDTEDNRNRYYKHINEVFEFEYK